MAIRVWAHVDAAEAVRAGSAVSGYRFLDLSDEDLGKLSDSQRWELSELKGLGCQECPGGSNTPEEIPSGKLDMESLSKWLNDRAVERLRFTGEATLAAQGWIFSPAGTEMPHSLVGLRKYLTPDLEKMVADRVLSDDAAKRKREEDALEAEMSMAEKEALEWLAKEPEGFNPPKGMSDGSGDYWNSHRFKLLSRELKDQVQMRNILRMEIIARQKREADEAEELARAEHIKAREELVRQIGSESQKQRLADGLLPEDEAEMLVREHLFTSFGDAERYERLVEGDVHDSDCYGEVEFSVETATELPEGAYAQLLKLRKLSPQDVKVTPRLHKGSCESCGDEAIRYSALATATWHGKEYSREYSLG